MLFRWLPYAIENGVCWTHVSSLAFGRTRPCGRVYLVIRKRAWLRSIGAQKTVCGGCGRVQAGWYDRRTRRVRDLSCGDTRVYLEFEVRRVQCRTKRDGLGGFSLVTIWQQWVYADCS
jgi:hypothetical protein